MKLKIYFFISIIIATTNFSVSFAEDSAKQKPNTTNEALKESAAAAEKWLQMLDQQKYDESWDVGSLTLRLTLPKQHWSLLMEKVRKPYGSLVSRELADERPSKDPPFLPKGDYMVVVFKSSFSHQPKVNEMVQLVQESDGKWRVLTYMVQ